MSYDPAFLNTASTRSGITYIDGDAGILRYRGYPIEQLAEHASFLETAWLLFEGELPTRDQLGAWEEEVRLHTYVHTNVTQFLDGFRHDAHPMGMLLGAVAALSTFYPDAKEMLDEIGDVENVPAFIEGVKNHERLLMGFGHRVYKNDDPRAKLIKRVADDVFAQTRVDPKLEIALELERIALEDDYFVSRKLYPNVDFYSGIIYRAMGYPTDYFTVLFALGRLPGWFAQWRRCSPTPSRR